MNIAANPLVKYNFMPNLNFNTGEFSMVSGQSNAENTSHVQFNNNLFTEFILTSETDNKNSSEQKSLMKNFLPENDETLIKKTKNAISKCKYLALAAGIVYFAMRNNLKYNQRHPSFRRLKLNTRIVLRVPYLREIFIEQQKEVIKKQASEAAANMTQSI